MKTFLIAVGLVVAAPVHLLEAGSVIQGVTATASSWWGMPAVSYQHPGNLVNNSGLSVPYDITATHAPNGDADKQWHAREWANDPNPVLTFSLGGTFDLETLHIWNANQGRLGENNTGRGVKSFTVSVSTNGTTFSEALTAELVRSPFVSNNVGPVSAQTFNLKGRNGITTVRIRVNSIHDPANPYPGLSEVMFTAVEKLVPVPITRVGVGPGRVTAAFASTPGQLFSVFRSVDLVNGFDTPLVTGIPAATATVAVTSSIDNFDGGATLGDSTVDFTQSLSAGKKYVFVPSNGLSLGREIAVVSWSGNAVTLAQDISADLTWNGDYKLRTLPPTETEWIDTAPPAGRAFYRVGRK